MLRRLLCLTGRHKEWDKVVVDGRETIHVYQDCPYCDKELVWSYA